MNCKQTQQSIDLQNAITMQTTNQHSQVQQNMVLHQLAGKTSPNDRKATGEGVVPPTKEENMEVGDFVKHSGKPGSKQPKSHEGKVINIGRVYVNIQPEDRGETVRLCKSNHCHSTKTC